MHLHQNQHPQHPGKRMLAERSNTTGCCTPKRLRNSFSLLPDSWYGQPKTADTLALSLAALVCICPCPWGTQIPADPQVERCEASAGRSTPPEAGGGEARAGASAEGWEICTKHRVQARNKLTEESARPFSCSTVSTSSSTLSSAEARSALQAAATLEQFGTEFQGDSTSNFLFHNSLGA